jgi:hypothetical protein
MEISMEAHKKLKIELPYDPAIPLLSIYQMESKSACNRETCAPMFVVVLITKVKLWNRPRCPSMDKR